MLRRRHQVPLLCVAVALNAIVGVAQARAGPPRLLDERAGAGELSTLDDYAVWSRHLSDRSYRLMIRRGGSTRGARIPTRQAPFDVSLGRDAHGRVVATYSRCRAVPRVGLRDCRLWVLDLRSGREEHLAFRSSATIRSRFDPAISGNRIAYGALVVGANRKVRVEIYVQTIGRNGRPRKLPGGTPGYEPGPQTVAFDGRRVVYPWLLGEAPCADANAVDGFSSELWIDDISTHSHQLAFRSGCAGDTGGTVYAAQVVRHYVYFAESTGMIGRYDLRTQQTTYAPCPGSVIGVAAQPKGYFLLLRRTDLHKAELLQQRLAFAPTLPGAAPGLG
jgi:hypothetical protein